MEQTALNQKQDASTLPDKVIAETSLILDSFEPVNEYLLCKKIALPTHTSGGIEIPESSRNVWGGRAEIVLVSENLNPYLNKYKSRQHILYPKGTQIMEFYVDDELMFLIRKDVVGAIVKK